MLPGPTLFFCFAATMRSCQVLHILLVICGAQYFGEGLNVINTTMSGDSGQYLLYSLASNTFFAVAIHFMFSSGVMQVSSRQPKSIENSNACAPERILIEFVPESVVLLVITPLHPKAISDDPGSRP